ncbi:MAG TPA: hypothetical protein VN684_00535 [Terriglobales bacterium]|nr:hypothetical protein [Terriglobales bacterium]
MPGIVGLITQRPRQQAEAELQRMVRAVCHESFYKTGMWVDESLGVYVGWSVQQGTFSEAMPVQNGLDGPTLIFSGEEYSNSATDGALGNDGGETNGSGTNGHDPGPRQLSYLVRAYENDPSAYPAGLNGRFHGLVADRRRGSVTLFNDRYGMHRLYYHQAKDAFYFAAEAKAILQVRPELREADWQSMGEMVSCGCVLEDRSVFKGIQAMPPASAWDFRERRLRSKKTYFKAREWEEQALLDPEEYYKKFREVFTGSLHRYFNGQQKIGMSVTGGLDTRMILAWRKFAPGSLPCYTFGSMYRDSRDVVVSRQISKVSQQSHEVIEVGEDFLSRFGHYAERSVYLTDACVDVSRSPDLYVQERARAIAPVRVAGTYGSEVLRPVRPRVHKGQRWAAAFKPEPPIAGPFGSNFFSHVLAAGHTYTRVLEGHPVSFSVFRQAPWYHHGVLALEESQITVRSPYLDNDIVRTTFLAPESMLSSPAASLRLIAEGNRALRNLWTDRGLAGNSSPFASKMVRNYQEFTFKAEYAYDYGMPQALARMDHRLSKLHLERLFLGRHKFYHFRVWYRDALSKYVRDVLLDPRSLNRPYVDGKGLEAIVQGHVKGDRNYTGEIHKLLTLELMHRLFLDPQ